MDGMDWRWRGACRDEDPELWYPLSYKGKLNQEQVAEAKAVCRRCPVTSTCLAYAIEHGIRDGIFGGHTPAERPKVAPRKGGKRPVEMDEAVVLRAVNGTWDYARKLTTEELLAAARLYMARTGFSAFSAATHLRTRHTRIARLMQEAS